MPSEKTPCLGPVTGLGMRAKAPAVGRDSETDGTGVWRWFSFRWGFGMLLVTPKS